LEITLECISSTANYSHVGATNSLSLTRHDTSSSHCSLSSLCSEHNVHCPLLPCLLYQLHTELTGPQICLQCRLWLLQIARNMICVRCSSCTAYLKLFCAAASPGELLGLISALDNVLHTASYHNIPVISLVSLPRHVPALRTATQRIVAGSTP
jgi:hypothetical protein